MKKVLLSLLLICSVSYGNKGNSEVGSSNGDVKILAKNDENKPTVTSLDSKKVPRIDIDPSSFPTIKNFREGYSSEACYKGSSSGALELLKALVDAANGDGDSWAELKTIKKDAKTNVIKVVAVITSEAGEHEEEFTFPPCK